MKTLVIDTETTGLDHEKDRIVEIAGVWRGKGARRLFWDGLCNPGIPIPPEAKAVHHITENDVKDAETPDEAIRGLLSSFFSTIEEDNVVYVAHNAAFDRGFLPIMAGSPWVCTWRCAMHIWPDAPSHSNQVLRYWLELDPEVPTDLYPHRALYDAMVTEAILSKMLERHSVAELIELSGKPVVLRTVRFGKHKGQLWMDVPRDYLRWVLKQSDIDADVRHTAYHVLSRD